IVESEDSDTLCARPMHPYTRALFAAALPSHPDDPPRERPIAGEVPSALSVPSGCRFHPRCPSAMPICSEVEPVLRPPAAHGEVVAVSHGTTVATNALLEERFDGLALVTTTGFRHVLEIARQSVPQGYGNSYFWVKPERIVPLHQVREVPERVDFRGRVLEPLDAAAAAAIASSLRERRLSAVGISFIHPY